MNKKILAVGLAIAMLATAASVFAEDVNENDVMLISTEVEEIKSESTISKEHIVVGEEGIEIAEDTLLYDNKGEEIEKDEIVKDSEVIVFKDAEKTIAVILVRADYPGGADLDVYTISEDMGDLINAKGDLVLHLGEETEVLGLKTKRVVKDELSGKTLLVFHSLVMQSLPAQTSPEKIIVLAEDEEVVADANAVLVESAKVQKSEEVVMLPLREVAEGLGYEVGWDNELKKITVGTVPMGVNFVIGVNEYNKARMMPFTLEKAPELVVSGEFGVTYVPASFFREVLEAEVVENEDGTVTITK